jgi:hypothetical protein
MSGIDSDNVAGIASASSWCQGLRGRGDVDRDEEIGEDGEKGGTPVRDGPSPTRLMASTVRKMTMPGMVESHQAARRCVRPLRS